MLSAVTDKNQTHETKRISDDMELKLSVADT